MNGWFTPHPSLAVRPTPAEIVPEQYVRRGNPKVQVKAWKLDKDNASHLVWLTHGHEVTERDANTNDPYVGINVPSLGGVFRVSEGEWLVKLGERTFMKMYDAEFNRTYREA